MHHDLGNLGTLFDGFRDLFSTRKMTNAGYVASQFS
jgi:hypothetical protein